MGPPVTSGDDSSHKRAKQAIRVRLRADRAAGRGDPGTAAGALAAIALPRLAGLASVAMYLSLSGEPGTWALRAGLAEGRVRVLLPWLRDDADLDWVLDEPGGATATEGRAAMRPPGRLLGVDAVTAAAAVVLPALAVDTDGRRLGRGGGSYDRVLARLADVRPAPLLVGCVFDDEVRDAALNPLPEEPHDRRVDVLLTPTRWLELRPASAR